MIIFLIACGVGLCCHLVPTWFQLGRQNLPQIQPSWFQDPSKNGSRCRPIFCLIFDRPGIIFCEFGFQVSRPGGQKIIKSVELSPNLVFFAISDILPTKNHMIDFLANLSFNLAPQTHPNSIQEPSKIDQTGYRKYDASWKASWTQVGTKI